ncbi:unnamed protein product [Miscanthus lutarioriparius]|uniref:C2H2-type domain-containing protein n=1 Tax=Miscanthus lutarioriparius TaxID=422564 RepID=A0A811RKE0_9POAL|nr:unnamed protein product [Miscanthus lutarioriparius]
MAQNIIYKSKEVDFHGEKRNILYPKHGHSRTALLVLANCMLLKGSLTISPHPNNDYPQQSLILRLSRIYRMKHSALGGDCVITKTEMDNSVQLLSGLIDVQVDFTSNARIRSSTVRLDMFNHMKVQLLHAWLVHPDDTVIFGAVGTDYHHVFMIENSGGLPVYDRNADPLVLNFLSSGVTAFGIHELKNSTLEGQIFALFWNGSFHTLTKHNGTLFLLNNVIDALATDMLWKEFNEHDDGQFCNSNFVAAPMDENKSEDIQNAQAEVPTSQTAPAVSQRMYKCERHNCQTVFLSLVNSNRHKQVHGKNPKLKMASFSKAELSKHWDELNHQEAGKVLSIKDMNIQGISGGLLYRMIEKIDNGDEFYSRTNRMKVVLDGTKKISSDELFTVLDKDSENTAFSTDIRFCPEKVVFSQQLLLLHDLNNVLACCCYFVEKNLDFMENLDAIGKYWDDLTCDQTRQILSLNGIKITGSNLKKLKHRLKNLDQNHPLAMTSNQLIDIISCSKKTTSRELFAVLEKASEDTHFSNDLRHCKDDEIFAVGGNKRTPSNDVALLSYMIERKLVQEWYHFKEGVTSDIQGQLMHDRKSEQSDTAEPVNMGGDKLLEKRDSTDCKAGHADGVPTSQDILNPIPGDTAASSLDRGAGHSDSGSTSQPSLDPIQGILLEQFVRSNKLTKIYKIRPNDVFKPLKRSLKTLKKDLDFSIHKQKLKAVFKLSLVILTRSGRRCARGFLLWIVKNHRERKSWNGSFQFSDMQVLNGQFIISKAADMELSLESASADFKRLWDLLLVPYYKNAELGSYPLYFDEFGHGILNLPDPVTDPDNFMKYEKYLALHFAFMPPLSRSTLLINLYKAYDTDRSVPDHAYKPLNKRMTSDWRDCVKYLPILTSVYYFNVDDPHLNPYSPTYFHLLKFSRNFGSHDLDHTKLPGLQTQLVSDMMITDLVIGQLLAPSLVELVLFIVNHTNMEGRFFRAFQAFESSDDEVFFCVEDDDDNEWSDSEGTDSCDASA